VLSRFNQDPSDHHEPYPWLEEKVYAKLRQRTVDLVKQSVDALLKDNQRVSLATVSAKSREFDEKGISESAILDNREARAYYEQHRSWQGNRQRRAKPLVGASPTQPGPVKPDRNEQRARQRYLRMSKGALVERLLAVERTSAQERERWLSQQDDVLTWRLRTEAAEGRLAQQAETSTGRKHEMTPLVTQLNGVTKEEEKKE
jgi:hypothetical protein